MVKRVKDMTQKVADGHQVDGKKIVEAVKEIASVVTLSSEATTEQQKASSKNDRKHIYASVCPLCEMKVDTDDVSFYNIALLKKFMSVRGKIIPRSKTGLCASHQRAVARAIKRARYLALLPYVDTGV